MVGTHLAKDGRSTSLELYEARLAHPSLVHKTVVPNVGDAYVMPASLYKEKWTKTEADKPAELSWVKKAMNQLLVSDDTAKAIADMTFGKIVKTFSSYGSRPELSTVALHVVRSGWI